MIEDLFNVAKLPAQVALGFMSFAKTDWKELAKVARSSGMKDLNDLTDLVFYFTNPKMMGKKINPHTADGKAQAKEWLAYRKALKIMFRAGKSLIENASDLEPGEWTGYTGSFASTMRTLPDVAKEWMATPPSHKREVAIILLNETDYGRPVHLLVWRTPTMSTLYDYGRKHHFDNVMRTFREYPTSMAGVKDLHNLTDSLQSELGANVGKRMWMAHYTAYNMYMKHLVYNQGMYIDNAKRETTTALANEAKQIIEITTAVLGGAGGAKSGGVPKHAPSKSLALSKLDWKGYVDTLGKLARGEMKGVAKLTEGIRALPAHETIYEGGRLIGTVRHFD